MKLTWVILLWWLQYIYQCMGEGEKVMKTDNKGIDNSEVLASGTEGEKSYISLPYLLYYNHGFDLCYWHLLHWKGH